MSRTAPLTFTLLAALAAACGDGGGAPDAVASHDAAPTADATGSFDAPPAERAVTITFDPRVGALPFACGSTYADQGADHVAITPQDFRIYVSEVSLIADDGSVHPVTLTEDAWQARGVTLLDFEDFTGSCTDGTPETNLSIRGTADNLTYTGLRFRIGIPDEVNHVDLIDVPSPLDLTGLWWGWNFGHIFLAAVAETPITDPEPGVNDFYFHLGSTGCTGDAELGETVTCSYPNRPTIDLAGFDPTSTPIVADYGALLARSPLSTAAGCHSFPDDTCAWPFDLVGMNFVTGSETPSTQRLFRVGE